MEKHIVKVNILNTEYSLVTEENDEYVSKLAKKVEENIEQAMLNNSNISTMSAAILTAMDFCDKACKSEYKLQKNINKKSSRWKYEKIFNIYICFINFSFYFFS